MLRVLCHSLLDPRPHLVIVSSEVHAHAKLAEWKLPGKLFANLSNEITAKMMDRYNVSKLLEIFTVRQFVQEHACDPEKYPININLANPSLCHTELLREVGFAGTVLKFFLHARTTEEGGRTLVIAAAAGKESHGEYISNGQVEQIAKWIHSEDGKTTQKRTYDELKDKLESKHIHMSC